MINIERLTKKIVKLIKEEKNDERAFTDREVTFFRFLTKYRQSKSPTGAQLYDVIKNSDFADKVESRISGIVCPLVQQMTGKFSDHLSGMKSSLISNPLNMQS